MRLKVSGGAVILAAGAAVLGVAEIWRAGGRPGEVWATVAPWLVVSLAALVHELGHIAAARSVGVGIRGMKLDLFGARLELDGLLSYGRECWIAICGPLANYLSAVMLYPIHAARGNEWLDLFLGASLVLGGVNLLPVGTLDGGRLLRSLTAWLFGVGISDRILRVTTAGFLGLLCLIAAYALLRRGELLSVFAFSLCLLGRAVEGERMN